MMAIAFFDLDRTLISKNSATLWLRFERKAGRISMRRTLWALGWVVRYSLGATELTEAIKQTVATLKGQSEAEMRARVAIFYEEWIRSIYRPGARETVERHRQQGDRLVLLTSSSNYMSEHVCRDLGLDDHLCNRFEVDPDGLYTGRAIEPLSFGQGKVELATAYAAQHRLPLGESTFYTDSHSDLPMLEAVGHPVAVHPDPRLRRTARKRGWPVVGWAM